MASFTRKFNKKEWRQNIEKCWSVQETLKSCVSGTEEYQNLNSATKTVIDKSISKGFINEYINFFMFDATVFKRNTLNFYDKSSSLWKNNAEPLTSLDEKCNLFSLFDCMEQNINLTKLDGNYEYVKRYS
jgi:hypothetical protein